MKWVIERLDQYAGEWATCGDEVTGDDSCWSEHLNGCSPIGWAAESALIH
jgi:hypothetical protein